MSPSPVRVPFEHRLRDSSGKRENGRVSAPFNERKSFFLDHRVRLVISRSAIYRVGLRYTCSSYEPLLNLSSSCLLFLRIRSKRTREKIRTERSRSRRYYFVRPSFNIREGIDRSSSARFPVARRKRERGFRNWNLTALKRVEKSRRISPSSRREWGTEKKGRKVYRGSCLEEGEREERKKEGRSSISFPPEPMNYARPPWPTR